MAALSWLVGLPSSAQADGLGCSMQPSSAWPMSSLRKIGVRLIWSSKKHRLTQAMKRNQNRGECIGQSPMGASPLPRNNARSNTRMLLKGADMENDWQVTLYANTPVWQYGNLIGFSSAPSGERVPHLMCNTVVPLPTGFVELTVAQEGTPHTLTLLVPTPHVMCAIHLKQRHQTGFAMPPSPSPSNADQPVPTTWRTSSRPSTPVAGEIPGTE